MCQRTITVQQQQLTGQEVIKPVESKTLSGRSLVERDDIFAKKNSTVDLSLLWNRTELNMISAVVTFFEVALLLFATTQALVSIVNPKIKSGMYSLFVILPLAIILPAYFGRVEASEELDD